MKWFRNVRTPSDPVQSGQFGEPMVSLARRRATKRAATEIFRSDWFGKHCGNAGLAGVIAVCATGGAAAADTHTVRVDFTGARSDDGRLVVCLRTAAQESVFPRCAEGAGDASMQRGSATLVDGAAGVVFENVAAGRYAISALHDENGDGEMNRRFRRPAEGLAVSNVETLGLPPPGFEDAAFEVEGDASLTIAVQYF